MLEWLSRIYVIAAGLGWALLASLEFVIAPGRLTPLPEALPGLLLSLQPWPSSSCSGGRRARFLRWSASHRGARISGRPPNKALLSLRSW
jgi:hypothetical protein